MTSPKDLLRAVCAEWQEAKEVVEEQGLGPCPARVSSVHERHLPPVMDGGQVAAWLRLASGRQALELARRQVLPCVRIGKRVLFLRDGVLRALEKAEIPAISDQELAE